jgi:signal peptidase II
LKKASVIILLILIADQAVKIWIKTHMFLGESTPVFGHWFLIHFTENEGMAFGMKLGGDQGKLILSLFRITAVILLTWWLYRLTRKKVCTALVVCISLIIAGATGNILDSAFYGMIFNDSTFNQVATLFPAGGGYAPFLYGRVVDMFYFPIASGFYPSWVPFIGGDDFIFFRPVFNIADSSITIGVLTLVIFQKKLFPKPEQPAPDS